MAAADTARLIASLELDSRKFQAGMNKATGSLGKIEGRLGAFSGFVNRNLGRALDRAASIGINALTDGIRGGIDSLSQLEDATAAVTGALKQTGQTGQVTAAQIAQWANEIEAATDAAFDDKDITRNAATLIRYGKVSAANLRPTLEVMTDLAAKTGSVDSAAEKLAKSLADPAHATRVLREVGVTLTDQQQKQIKAFLKAGKLGKAQAIILEEVGKATKGAAKDSKGAFGDMQNTLADTVEDAQRLLGEAAFPVLQRIGTKLKEALADPRTMQAIKDLGTGAAQALDKILDFATKVPWGTIADGLGKAAGFAKTLFDAFASMPPEVQATLIALAGLNKLSGGAVSGIVGELGKGLIKGVLGINAGIVHVNGPVAGGGPGAGPGAGASLATLLSGGVAAAIGVAAAEAFASSLDALTKTLTPEGSAQRNFQEGSNRTVQGAAFGPFESIRSVLFDFNGTMDRTNDAINQLSTFINSPHPDFLGDLGKLAMAQYRPNATPADTAASMQTFRAGERESWTEPLKAIGTKQDAARATFEGSMAAVERTTGTGLRGVDSTARSGLSGATAAVNNSAARISSAITSSRPITNVDVQVNVTPTGVQKATTTAVRYGPINGSKGGGTGGGGSKYE